MQPGACVVINRSFEFLSINDWYSAIGLVLRGKANTLATYDTPIRAERVSIPAPAVIQLTHMAHVRRRRQPFTLPSHRNVWIREQGRCAYCGVKVSLNAVTKDHVVPLGQGGKDDLLNVVACCTACNGVKACRTPAQAGMRFREGVSLRHLTDEEKLQALLKTSQSHERKAWLGFLQREGLSLF
jgi:5-methylcytosine-specific restriction endonuclease McrA